MARVSSVHRGGDDRDDPDDAAPSISGYGRQRLFDAALRLFDERGIDAVSARAVAQAAGHGNVAAVSYHFGSIGGLLRAVLLSHQERIDLRRQRLLDELEATREPITPRAAIDAICGPFIDTLGDAEGRRYVRVLNQARNHPTWVAESDPGWAPGIARGIMYVLPLMAHVPDRVRAHRGEHALGFLLFAVAEQARLIDSDAPSRAPLDRDVFRAEVVAVVEHILGA